MFQFGSGFFHLIEERFGKTVSTVLLGLVILAIAVFCGYLIWTDAIAPLAQVIVGSKVSLNGRDIQSAIISSAIFGLATWIVFRFLMNAWIQGTHRVIERLERSQESAREIIREVKSANESAHDNIQSYIQVAHNEVGKWADNLTVEAVDILKNARKLLGEAQQLNEQSKEVRDRLRAIEDRLGL